MLERMRRNMSGVFAYLLIGLLVVSFSLWGIGDVFSRIGEEPVAQVGNEDISAERLRLRLQRLTQIYEAAGQRLDPQTIREQGLDVRELTLMMAQKSLDIEADALGLTVPNSLVAQEIRDDPGFRNAFGIFDPDRYRSILTQVNLNEQDYIAERKHIHTRRQIEAMLSAHVLLPQGLLEALVQRQSERRVFEYVVLPPSVLTSAVIVDRAAVEAFYNTNPALFTVPQSRNVTVLLLNPAAIRAEDDISQSDLEYAYSINPTRFAVPARLDGAMLTYPSPDAASDALARAGRGTEFEELAEALGVSMTEARFSDYTASDFLSAELAEAVAAAPEGEVRGWVETPLGFVVFQVRNRIEASIQPLAEVARELRAEVALARARSEIETLHDLIEDELASGATLAETAAKFSLDAVRADALTPEGLDALAPSLFAIPDLVGELFLATPEDAVLAQTLPEGYYWLEVRSINPSRLPSFAEIEEEATEFYRKAERGRQLRELAHEIAEQINAGGDFASLVARYDRAPLSTGAILRTFNNEVFSERFTSVLYTAREGEARDSRVSTGEGVVIARVVDIPDLGTLDPATREDIETRFEESFVNELLEQYIVKLQQQQGTHIFEDRLEDIFIIPTQQPGFF